MNLIKFCNVWVLQIFLCGLYLRTTKSLSNWLSITQTGFNASYEQPCNTTPHLTDQQRLLCEEDPNTLNFVADGISMSLAECQQQFKDERWNCSTESYINFPSKGTKESAFISSLTSAAVAYSISRACSRGNLAMCSCAKYRDMRRKKREDLYMETETKDWKWGGCSDNVNFGVKFTQKFGDAPEEELEKSLLGAEAMAILHNNRIGRKMIIQATKTKCKCHGPSGTCAVKFCWRVLDDFGQIGDKLKMMYDKSAVQVAKRKRLRPVDKSIERRSLKFGSLVYISRSPDFCVRHPELGIQGVKGRRCNRNETGIGSCNSLCCGRGYNTQLLEEIDNCNCKFHWCCHVTCDKCLRTNEVYTCK